MRDQPKIKLIGGPFDGQTLQVPELMEYFVWPHGAEDITYSQASFPYHYYFEKKEYV